jgi:hypothetical protein
MEVKGIRCALGKGPAASHGIAIHFVESAFGFGVPHNRTFE